MKWAFDLTEKGMVPDVSSLQIALAKHFSLPLAEVHVVTHIIASGHAVENGKEVHW